MRAVVVIVAALLAAGCGVLDDEGPAVQGTPDPAVYGPPSAVPREQPAFTAPRPVAARLDRGAIGVVDLAGEVAIEPTSLDTASDATLTGVRWSSWGVDGARGTGTLRVLNCQPSCAAGGSEELRARITLSGVRVCEGRRYFASGSVELVGGSRRPFSYVGAPC